MNRQEMNRQDAKDAKIFILSYLASLASWRFMEEIMREPSKEIDDLANAVIGAAIEVHRTLGRAILKAFMKRRWRWN